MGLRAKGAGFGAWGVGRDKPGQMKWSGIRLYWAGLCDGKDFAAGRWIFRGIVVNVMFRLEGKGLG
jgi:hypothetical protein